MSSSWWAPERHAARRDKLILRNRIRSAVRAWFEADGFVEVENAVLQVSPGNETHLHAFATEALGGEAGPQRLYLHTSPEFSAKKLLAAGETRIFEFARVFRSRERSALHVPEFVMLEWYRTGKGLDAVMNDAIAIVGIAAETAGRSLVSFRGREADATAWPERLSVADAFRRHAGIDLFATIATDGAGDRDGLAAAARAAGIRTAEDDTWSDVFSRILSERVEPRLGIGRPTLLHSYPISEAALARPDPVDPRVALRFELYLCGVELANGFDELTDPAEQRRRFVADMDEKERLYGERYPIDEDFLAAIAAMPPASGVALGFDRLVMLAAGAERVADVQWTPPPDPV